MSNPRTEAAAETLMRQYESEYQADHLTWRDFAESASEVLAAADAADPLIRVDPGDPATIERGAKALYALSCRNVAASAASWTELSNDERTYYLERSAAVLGALAAHTNQDGERP